MAIRYLDNINLEENQLLNASLQQVSSDPTGFEGQIIYNTTSNVFKYYNGSTWISLDGSGDITQVNITAGNGLSGTSVNTTSGAHIQTLTVGQGTGITVNASSVAVDSTVIRTTGTQTIGGLKTFTTIPVVGTAAVNDDTTKAASTAWVKDQNYSTTTGTMSSWRITGDTGTSGSVVQNDLVDIQGGTGINTSASGLVVDVELDLDELPTVTSYTGSTEYIPMVTAGNTSSKILGNNISVTQLGAPTANFDIDTNKVINVVNPTASQDAATKNYVDTTFAGSGALIFQGGYNAATNTPDLDVSPSSLIRQGWTYAVTAPGQFFGETVEDGDLLIAESDSPTALASWTVVQNNVGIATATVKGIANFPTAGGLTVATGAVSMPNVVSAGSVGSVTQSLSITTDAKGRVTSRSAQTIAIPSTQITDFCNAVETCISDASEYTTTIGNGTLLTHTVTHNLGSKVVMVQLFDTSSGETVNATVVRTTPSAITVSTSTAITTNDVTVMVKKIV